MRIGEILTQEFKEDVLNAWSNLEKQHQTKLLMTLGDNTTANIGLAYGRANFAKKMAKMFSLFADSLKEGKPEKKSKNPIAEFLGL